MGRALDKSPGRSISASSSYPTRRRSPPLSRQSATSCASATAEAIGPKLRGTLTTSASRGGHAESCQPALLEVGHVEVFGFHGRLFAFAFRRFSIGQGIDQSRRPRRAAKAFVIGSGSFLLIGGVLVAEDWGLQHTHAAGFRSVDKQGVEGGKEETIVHGAPRSLLHRTMPDLSAVIGVTTRWLENVKESC